MANLDINALTLSGATTSVNGPDIQSQFGNGAVIVINITAITGTSPTATFTVEGRDPISGVTYPILASAARTATGTTVLRIHPGLAAVANLVANDIFPSIFRVRMTIGGTTPSVTATVGVCLVD